MVVVNAITPSFDAGRFARKSEKVFKRVNRKENKYKEGNNNLIKSIF